MNRHDQATAFKRKDKTFLQKAIKAFALGFVGLVSLASIACVLACILHLFS